VKWTEKLLFGNPRGYAASAYDPFRTVSLGTSVNKGMKKGRGVVAARPFAVYLN
jgi:hypothetical protein